MDVFSTYPHQGRMLRVLAGLLIAVPILMGAPAVAASRQNASALALTPPMGWNDWAHYQCNINAHTILSNARELVHLGLAKHGYDTVTIDDCWMQKRRDANGNLQPNRKLFPHGIKAVATAVHALGLKFGIYEDAGYATCGGFAGSGVPKGGGKAHFLQDATLFASWGVDYLKLDGCNVYVSKGETKEEAYRRAYAAERKALDASGRPIVFLESAPAYFMRTPQWYSVLHWAGSYGQLWREGTDVETYDAKNPDRNRFHSVMWNYAYNLPLGRFQGPGNWNDADFIIGGDAGMTIAETRSQVALWSMMSSPLILSSNLSKLSPQAVATLSNSSIIAVDQDKLGRMATLVTRTPAKDVLLKPLADGDYAVAVFNHSPGAIQTDLRPSDLGFSGVGGCHWTARNLWTGQTMKSHTSLRARIASQDTVIWRVDPSSACGKATRTGEIVSTTSGTYRKFDGYAQCLSSTGDTQACGGTSAETWTYSSAGTLESGGRCLADKNGKPTMQKCSSQASERWRYTVVGNLVSAGDECLTSADLGTKAGRMTLQHCKKNQLNQIWSLPN